MTDASMWKRVADKLEGKRKECASASAAFESRGHRNAAKEFDSRREAYEDALDVIREALAEEAAFTPDAKPKAKPVRSPKCVLCGREKRVHKSKTFECPTGSRGFVGYTSYGPAVFQDKKKEPGNG